jgi:hypothetical protein
MEHTDLTGIPGRVIHNFHRAFLVAFHPVEPPEDKAVRKPVYAVEPVVTANISEPLLFHNAIDRCCRAPSLYNPDTRNAAKKRQ